MNQRVHAGLCILFCGVSYALCIHLGKLLTTVHDHTIEFDPGFSSEVTTPVVCELEAVRGASIATYWATLLKLCTKLTSIKQVTLSLCQQPRATIQVVAHQPFVLINQQYCLTHNGHIFNRNQLLESQSCSLPMVAVNEYQPGNGAFNRTLYDWFQRTPQELTHHYAITWLNETTLCLQHHDFPFCKIQCTSETVLTDQLLTTCLHLVTKHHKVASSNQWNADIRFKNQIILTKNEVPTCHKRQHASHSQKIGDHTWHNQNMAKSP